MALNNKNEIYQDLIDQTKSLDMRVFGPMKVWFAHLQIQTYRKDLVVLRLYACKHLLWFDNVNVYDICRRMATNSQPGL